uniref:Uncharacterized protein n=1 Tax=Arundo donax TaxID=35708 RepID=A0A0A9DHF2_ARUDO
MRATEKKVKLTEAKSSKLLLQTNSLVYPVLVMRIGEG